MSLHFGNASDDEWRAFMTQPAAYVDSAHLARCFNGGLAIETCDDLKRSARLQDRLSALIADHFGLSWEDAETCAEVDRAIALSPAESLFQLALGSGAIYWSAAIADAILAPEVEALDRELGAALCAFALAHRDLAGAGQSLQPLDALGSRILDDGWRCLDAWRRGQPEGVALRVALKLPPTQFDGLASGEDFERSGPEIVRRAASWLF